MRRLILANGLIRLAYGVGALIAPRAMARAGVAPELEDRQEARLFVRGFGAHQIGVAVVAIAALRNAGLRRPAMALAIAIDTADILSAVAEAQDRGRIDDDIVGGALFSAAGAVSAALALWGSS